MEPNYDLKTNFEYVGYMVDGFRERGVAEDNYQHEEDELLPITQRSRHRWRRYESSLLPTNEGDLEVPYKGPWPRCRCVGSSPR